MNKYAHTVNFSSNTKNITLSMWDSLFEITLQFMEWILKRRHDGGER